MKTIRQATLRADYLRQSAARLPDVASTAAVRVEIEVDDFIHRHSEHYPHYRHYDIVPPRPVVTYHRNEADGVWEFSGHVALLPYELKEAEEVGLEAWLRGKIGPQCARLDIGTPGGAVIPIRASLRGAAVAAHPGALTTPARAPSAFPLGRDRVAPRAPQQGVLRPA